MMSTRGGPACAFAPAGIAHASRSRVSAPARRPVIPSRRAAGEKMKMTTISRRAPRLAASGRDDAPASSPPAGESTADAVLRVQCEALDAETKLRLAELRARKEQDRNIAERALELDKEMRIRAEGKRRAKERGGRRPTQRKALPIAFAGLQCAVMSVASFEATNRVATFLTEADDVTNRTLLVNLAVGGGVGVTCLLVISTIILFAVAVKEGHGVLTNTPVTFYRCDGMDPNCCANGPHGLGAHPRFTYLNDGRGFETRQKDSMRRHLVKRKRCRELKPVVIYPKEEGWKLY